MRRVGLGSKQFIDSDRIIRVFTDENDLPRIGSFMIHKNQPAR